MKVKKVSAEDQRSISPGNAILPEGRARLESEILLVAPQNTTPTISDTQVRAIQRSPHHTFS